MTNITLCASSIQGQPFGDAGKTIEATVLRENMEPITVIGAYGNGDPVEILSLDIGEKTTPEAIVTDSAIILCYKDSGETEFISRQ